MTKETAIKLFEQKQIRSIWIDDEEKWYFSIVDVLQVLIENDRPRKYWSDLKSKLIREGSEVSEKIGQLKLLADDGKMRLTDVADTEQLFRLIQSVPSKKAEPFKLWLAQVGRERIDEIEDPELGFDRLMETYLKKGYSKEWVNQRLKSIEVRKDLTDEWDKRGVKKGQEYAILTDEITKAWSGLSVKKYKNHKGLKKENLPDNMSNLELVLNMLAEATTTEISKEKKPKNFVENKKIAKQGGTIAGNTRKQIEEKTGKKVVNKLNASDYLENKKELE
ncbi:Bro-N domain-containing protein [Flavobacterium franklandianum]|uniref:Bro-N domain-containing protein n=1 Tax=Flavobacterium franklandianum TaxID=2594430 RepID=A0A553CT78_9FLAO|nr:Bro-N domain-containing protein [Flavobacterium franklandianum]TRX23671.1 Bro-N domain-containing protein [Flavobacterium franklandianum]TRX27033.1 Bro-N domain-containing protein [Flavobacterium franklandianum]